MPLVDELGAIHLTSAGVKRAGGRYERLEQIWHILADPVIYIIGLNYRISQICSSRSYRPPALFTPADVNDLLGYSGF